MSFELVQLGDISQNISRRFDFKGREEVVFINTGDILSGEFLTDELVSVVGLPGQAKKAIKKGDILYSEIRPGNKRYLIVNDELDNYVVSTKFMVIQADHKKILPEYLYLILTSKHCEEEFKMIAESRSGTFPQVTFDSIAHYQVELPDLDVQKQIVDIAWSLSGKERLNTQTNQTLEQMAQALFKSWFVDFDPVFDNALDSGFFEREFEGEGIPEPLAKRVAIRQALREAAAADTDASAIGRLPPETRALFPDSFEEHPELSWIPKGWEASRLDSVLELAYGKALKKTDRIDGSISVYGSGGIGGYHNEALVSGPGIIVGRKGTVGSLFWEDDDFFPIDTVFYVKPHAGVPLGYCFELLKTLRLEGMNTDAAVPGLNRNNAYRLLFAKPSTDIKNLFANFINSLKAQQKSLHDQTKSLAAMRDTLLPKLLSGELTLATTESVESPISA
ncbi:restriction endonuclease subunit S [Shewanella algae]|uniref:restriction endonuclease subunit S n=1 Tax=Shewanella algae TaxID=38313 RepID=UPI000C333A51|nr:restriction endonuclease subunit S [Shewanella algae]MBO2624368.1 restriction endonuclease subunit S [Shewanella algae]MBO2641242.1 restriction endonuclease subunit S [Shewanella algae]MBO2649561.1 restriction endonuclease subunit S [Shewanella algae]TVL52565.1 hypothetical protein AYI98_02540 [Shewanella algae]